MAAVKMVNTGLNPIPGFNQQHCTSMSTDSIQKPGVIAVGGSSQSRNILWLSNTLVAWQRRHCWTIPEIVTISIDNTVYLHNFPDSTFFPPVFQTFIVILVLLNNGVFFFLKSVPGSCDTSVKYQLQAWLYLNTAG